MTAEDRASVSLVHCEITENSKHGVITHNSVTIAKSSSVRLENCKVGNNNKDSMQGRVEKQLMKDGHEVCTVTSTYCVIS